MSKCRGELQDHVKDEGDCVGEQRIKWICPEGPHHPKYFQNSTLTKEAEYIFASKTPEHWKLHVPNKSPLDPYRRWMLDRRGLRQDNWYNAPNDCVENVEQRFYKPYYKENCHNLIPLSERLTDFRQRHPGRLLNDFVYRVPDYYLKHKEETKMACFCDNLPPYKPPSKEKISEGCLKRFQFMANNCRTFDDGYAVDFNH